MRHFEWAEGVDTESLSLPVRQTGRAAGYDLFACLQTRIPVGEIVLVPTGVRAVMPNDEYLAIFARSSLAIKHRIVLANGVGIVDADYYGNENNGGHIFIALWNQGLREVCIERGERIAQGIFCSYRTVQEDRPLTWERLGGFGSTDA